MFDRQHAKKIAVKSRRQRKLLLICGQLWGKKTIGDMIHPTSKLQQFQTFECAYELIISNASIDKTSN